MDDVAAVRTFSRFYTRVLGVLDEGLLETPYSLTEARVLYELAQRDATEVVSLRRAVGIDAGYMSRLLSRFEADGLVERQRSADDARRQVIRLTRQGRTAFGQLDRRSDDQVDKLLAPLDAASRHRLVDAMRTIEKLLGDGEGGDAAPTVTVRPAGIGDYGWIVQRNAELYAEEYDWDETYEALVARIVADFGTTAAEHPGRVATWIAELEGERAGTVMCTRKDDTTAQLRLLLVEPAARGAGVGGRLVDECIRFARDAGYERLVLWTNDILTAARRIYERAGFTLDESEPHHSFGHDLVGQNWSLPLG
jgi:DNA-binding MarR family transcriptional regulator/GNAT superfamily N-acetyltransferase